MSKTSTSILLALALGAGIASGAARAAGAAYGPELQGFRYPYPVQHFRFNSQGQTMQMAYMDVKPKAKPGNATYKAIEAAPGRYALFDGGDLLAQGEGGDPGHQDQGRTEDEEVEVH